MRVQLSGRATAFQAEDEGSIPSTRTNLVFQLRATVVFIFLKLAPERDVHYAKATMGFSKSENFRQPAFCTDCPATQDMERIEIRRTSNPGPEVNGLYYADRMPTKPIIYAHDPGKQEAGAIALGEYGLVDPFCGCCEFSDSRVLGKTHERVQQCSGPEEKRGWFGIGKSLRCGAGFQEIGKLVNRLNESSSRDSNLHIIVEATPLPKNQPEA